MKPSLQYAAKKLAAAAPLTAMQRSDVLCRSAALSTLLGEPGRFAGLFAGLANLSSIPGSSAAAATPAAAALAASVSAALASASAWLAGLLLQLVVKHLAMLLQALRTTAGGLMTPHQTDRQTTAMLSRVISSTS
jgi:hypothetical protein